MQDESESYANEESTVRIKTRCRSDYLYKMRMSMLGLVLDSEKAMLGVCPVITMIVR